MSDYIFRMLWEVKKEEPSIFGVLIHDKLTIGSINMLYVYIIIIPVSKKLSGKVFILMKNAIVSIKKVKGIYIKDNYIRVILYM